MIRDPHLGRLPAGQHRDDDTPIYREVAARLADPQPQPDTQPPTEEDS